MFDDDHADLSNAAARGIFSGQGPDPAKEFWAGAFGDEYTERNRVDWRARVPFWKATIDITRPNTVLELGANAGWNLRAIREASPGTYACGLDVNAKAARIARIEGYDVNTYDPSGDLGVRYPVDLVFTAGLLIHIVPADLPRVMQNLVNASGRYVLAVEYEAKTEEEVPYRGHAGRLWRRPFGLLYEQMGLRLVHTGPATGFDRCTFWLMDKVRVE